MKIEMRDKVVEFFRCDSCRGMIVDDSPKSFNRHKSHRLKQPVGRLSLMEWIFVYYRFYLRSN